MKPIKFKGVKLENMDANEWEELDELAKSTIMLSLDKKFHYNVIDAKTNFEIWEKLCGLLEH